MPGAYGHGASALAMPNERWQEVVSDLIGKAEMIVAEVPVLTARCAVRARDLCREGENRANRCDYSVARRPFPLLDDEETIKQFPRVLWDDEMPAVGAKDSFVFRDLIARAGAMAQLEQAERIALVDSGRVVNSCR